MDRKYFTNSEDYIMTPHFKLSEMTFTDATGAYVFPDGHIRINLGNLCIHHLEPLRQIFGPIYINSGYRDEKRNAAVKGAANSYHLYGCACDIRVPSLYWGIRYVSFLLINNDCLLEKYRIAELILHKKQNYIHLAMRKDVLDTKFYLDIL